VPHLVYFEVTADDLDRAAQFYRDVFGWAIAQPDAGEDYYEIETGTRTDPGIPGGVVGRFNAYESVINTFDVDDVDEFAKKIAEAGGEVLAPKISIPGVGFIQYCQDTEGNTFGIIQYEEPAPAT
jgi:predicted enzyme related to lactoylglutathione lyase